MDFIDYRERLGIGFNDSEKASYFFIKMFNCLNLLALSKKSMYFEADEYISFCNIIGSELNPYILNDFDWPKRFSNCVKILHDNSNDIKNFLTYYVAFINATRKDKQEDEGYTRRDYANIATTMLKESHILYAIYEINEEYFFFPKGVKELDDALVSQPLEWLKDYPTAQKEWLGALKIYSDLTDENASDVADKFRKALECFFQKFFNTTKTLENMKSEYGSYLKSNGVPAEISNNLETLLQSYTNFMNGYAKHHNNTNKNILEYIMYQTGNIMRLLITLKQNEQGEQQ